MIPVALMVVALPCLAALPAFLLRRWRFAELLCAIIGCAVVCLVLALATPQVTVGPITFDLNTPLVVFGRALLVHSYDQYLLLTFFASALVILCFSWRTFSGWTFVPLGLVVLGLVSAAVIVRPFIFSALLMELAAALIAVMIQAEHLGERSTLGAIRFLTVSTLALPFFFAATYFVNQGAQIVDPVLQASTREPAIFLLLAGLILLIGAFPLFSWTHTLTRDAPPMVSAFVSTVMTSAVPIIFLSVQQENAWLRPADPVALWRTFGLAAVIFGGALAWAQQSFARVLACAMSVEAGASLLLLHLGKIEAIEANESLVAGMLVRAISIGVLAIGLNILRASRENDDFSLLRGAFHAGPSARIAALAIAAGGLSLAGFPGTPGFMIQWMRTRVLAPGDPEMAALLIVAGGSVGAGFVRGLASMLTRDGSGIHQSLRLYRTEFLGVAVASLALIVLGLAPEWIMLLARAAASALAVGR